MINNRQNARRRGRGGGPRPPNAVGTPNRQDNRSRGNASQLHEKYKALARDAQMAGDRVQTEYYHQFADHYYRVLNEMRSRYEEQRPRRDDQYDDEDDQDDNQANAEQDRQDGDEPRSRRRERGPREDRDNRDQNARPDDQGQNEREARPERNDRQDRTARPDRSERPERAERAERNDRPEYAERPERTERSNGEVRPRRQRTVHRDAGDATGEQAERISLDVLPPSIASVSDAGDDGAAKPRRRTRRKTGEDGDIAPAA